MAREKTQIPAAGSAPLLPCQVGAIISDYKHLFPEQEQRSAPGEKRECAQSEKRD